jgi:ribonuclease E
MAENNNPDHWADLLSQMGVPESAEPPKTEGSDQPQPPDPAPRVEPRAAKPPRQPAEVRRPTSDWDRLAEDLGVPVVPRPVREAPPSAPARVEQPQRRAAAAEPVAHVETHAKSPTQVPAEPVAREPAARESLFQGPTLEDAEPTPSEMWEHEIPDLSDPLFFDAPSAAGSEPEARDEAAGDVENLSAADAGREQSEERERADRKRGRRRRRGRRKGSRPAEGERDVQQAAAGEPARPADDERSEPADSTSASSTEEGGAAPSEGRSRRRRRRRGSDRHRKPEVAETAGSVALPEAVDAPEVADAADAVVEPLYEGLDAEADEPLWDGGMSGEADEHDDDDDSDDQVARLSHRAIPTWEEAIKSVIAPNLEARAKHPNGGQQHRGGRRSRGDRSRKS